MIPWEELERVVAADVLRDARRVSRALAELGVPHALAGGLAVGLHGHPRATDDVDFLVGPEAFESIRPILVYRPELADVVQVGAVDLIAALPDDPALASEVVQAEAGTMPVVGVEVLILMKLRAGRTQDLADVEALVRSGGDIEAVVEFLRNHEPRHLPAFGRCAQRALEP